MEFTYRGPMPVDDGAGGLVRPGDRREFESEPGWGPWEPSGQAPAAPAPEEAAPVAPDMARADVTEASPVPAPALKPKGM